ncbi:MAG TPA: hypothetical protein VGN46_02150 [Luteibacter sp.]|jgi:hypothetical protein|uniref:hypothetical protein n=1 Tax=Luteibacter sp. TaxID=1886636 RepID=UPI002F3E5B91
MLPERIRAFTASLVVRTENNEFVWVYDDIHSAATLRADAFKMMLRYSFSSTEICGEFAIIYTDHDGKEYRFYTNQQHQDYDLVRRLYEVAQSSGMRLPF